MVLANPMPNSLNADVHAVPTIHVDSTVGAAMKAYAASTATPTGSLTAGVSVFAPSTTSLASSANPDEGGNAGHVHSDRRCGRAGRQGRWPSRSEACRSPPVPPSRSWPARRAGRALSATVRGGAGTRAHDPAAGPARAAPDPRRTGGRQPGPAYVSVAAFHGRADFAAPTRGDGAPGAGRGRRGRRRATVTLRLRLAPGFYRVTIRTELDDGSLSRPVRGFVRVLR